MTYVQPWNAQILSTAALNMQFSNNEEKQFIAKQHNMKIILDNFFFWCIVFYFELNI